MFDPESAVVEALTSETLKVPPYPAVAMRLSKLLAKPDFMMDDVVKVLASDPTLAARVMGAANSSAVRGNGQEIESLSEAVRRIGSKRLSRIALASGVADAATAAGPLQELKSLVWRQSLCCAFVAQQVAPLRSLDSERAFLIGLLQGFGSTVVLGALEDACASHAAEAGQAPEAWLQIVARREAQAGAFLAKQWQLPQAIAEGLGSSREVTPMRELVRSARQVVSLMERHPRVEQQHLAGLVPSPEEQKALLLLLPKLPDVVSALEGGDSKTRASVEKLILKSNSVRTPEADSFNVLVFKGKQAIEFRGAIADRNTLALRGTQPLAENWLAKVEIEHDPKLVVWLRVTRCVPVEGGYAVEAQPFALNGDEAQYWAGLVSEAGVG